MNKLTITPEMRDGDLLLLWRGEIAERDPGASLSPYLTEIFSKCLVKKIILDFADVDLMNSSSLVPILALVKKAAAANFPIELRYNREVGWQRVSHQCMAVLCQKLSLVQVTYRK